MKKFPEIIVFDVDGVLVNVHGSFHKTVLETVRFFTGRRVTNRQLHQWKNKPGFNDDWKLSTAWVESLGGSQTYDEIKAKFIELYWGQNGDGYVRQEKWLAHPAMLARLSKRAELGIFTGRVWREMNYTLERSKVSRYFKTIVTAEDVTKGKPDPEGLCKVLGRRPPESAIYLGDNIDDALAAQGAGVAFAGILRPRSDERRERIDTLRELGALTILGGVNDLEPWLKRRSAPAAR